MKLLTIAAAAALSVGLGAAQAADFKLGDLDIAHPMAFEAAATAHAAGGYMTITNGGDSADRLMAVKAEGFGKVMLHESREDENGVARMHHLDGIDIPAGETVTLQPGGLHVMFMGLGGDALDVGETIPATLVFEKAGELEIRFDVEARGGHGAMDHSGHTSD